MRRGYPRRGEEDRASDGNVAADSLWRAQLEASGVASEAKRTFKAEYADRLRASGLSDSIPDY